MLLLRWLVNALGLMLVAYYVAGFSVSSFYTALIIAVVLGLVNAVIRPVVLLLTLPVNILTLGLFTFVVNALMIWFVATIVKGFEVTGFWPALYAALILWFVSLLTNAVLANDRPKAHSPQQ